LQQIYLALLEKQMAYCETHGDYVTGLDCGTCALRYDMAHERIHRRLMRLHYLAGNRTAALRQYERCVAFLRQELDVTPARRTVALYEAIRADQLDWPEPRESSQSTETALEMHATLPQALLHIKQLQTVFASAQSHLEEVIQAIEMALDD
jgi:DNA-binding SARP family transcriptional activator